MTNKTISLTIPNDDPIALHEFGAAMQRMAGRHGLEQATPAAAVGALREDVEQRRYTVVDTDKAQLAALGEAVEIVKAAAPALMDDKFKYDGEEVSGPRAETTQSHLDSDGLPWDARIHASSKERNADDTWRARRKPSDMDAGQWAEFQGQVRTELRELMELPVVAPPAPVEPVVPVAPPAPVPTEFVPFLQWITSSGITPEQVNVALAQHGLTAVPQLQQRPDLIPQVHATLAAGV